MAFESMLHGSGKRKGFEALRYAVMGALLAVTCLLGYYCGRTSGVAHRGVKVTTERSSHPAMEAARDRSTALELRSPARGGKAQAVVASFPSHGRLSYATQPDGNGISLTKSGETTAMQPPAVVSLPTGTRFMEDRATTGLGRLETINRTDDDAYVIVVDASTRNRVRQVYVKAHDRFTAEGLEPGRYQIFFATGLDWDGAHEEFKLEASYLNFGHEMAFAETPSSEGVLYDDRTITLSAVPHSSAQGGFMSKSEFHALTGWPLQTAQPLSTKTAPAPEVRDGGLPGAQKSTGASPDIPTGV